jgi:mono/diheme cytochrome c family protein
MKILAIAAVAVLMAGDPQIDPTRAAVMRGHYQDAMAVHAAVIRGDLPAAQSHARALAEYEPPPGMPPKGEPYVQSIRESAAKVSHAQAIVGAAIATSTLLMTCGDCHRATGAMASAPLVKPPAVGGVVGHMLAHQRAADQLLQGLVAPSESEWRQGALAFAAAPLRENEMPSSEKAARELLAREREVHRVATAAADARDPLNRAAFYGQILGGCADCHKAHAKVWGPKE